MKPLLPYIVCKADLEQKQKHKVEGTDIELYIETKYNNNYRERNPTYAEVVYVPEGSEFKDWDNKKQTLDLKPGDIICVQHFQLINDRLESQAVARENDEDLFFVDIKEIYFKVVDGKPVMLGNYLLCQYVDKNDDKYLLAKEESPRAIVKYVADAVEGIKSGDKVVYLPYSDYKLEFDGEEYLKMHSGEIIGKINE